MSTKTGFAPAKTAASAVAVKVKLGKMTSSFGANCAVMMAMCKAAVPLFTAMACLAPTKAANSDSKRLTMAPFPRCAVKEELFKTLVTS